MASRSIPPPGMMRHGPFPGLGSVAQRPTEHAHLDLLENKIALQVAEKERLARENQRFASTNITLREDLFIAQKELQRLHAHVGDIQAEREQQIKEMLDKMMKLESELLERSCIKAELQQAQMEAQSLITARRESTSKIRQMTQEVERVRADIQEIPSLYKELEVLRHEHQQSRSSFEHEKALNIAQVEQMQGMEKNLISMVTEAEKLHAELLSVEKRSHAPSSYRVTYGSHISAYLSNYDSGYVDEGGSYLGYTGGALTQGMNSYASVGGGDNGGRSANISSGAVGGNGAINIWGGSYDTVGGPPPSAHRYNVEVDASFVPQALN